MPITCVVFLDALGQSGKPGHLNETRLEQLQPLLHLPHYRVLFIGHSAEFNNEISRNLRKIGAKSEQFFIADEPHAFSDAILNLPYLKNKEHLIQDNDQSEIIVLGLPAMHLYWIQEAGFSLLDWPYTTGKSLTQLMEEQLQLMKHDAFEIASNSDPGYSLNFFKKKRSSNMPTLTSHCEREFQALLEAMHILRSEIVNLTDSTLGLELEQLALQKQMLKSEAGQTELLNELDAHRQRATADWILGSILIALHISDIIKGAWKSICWLNSWIRRVKNNFSLLKSERDIPLITMNETTPLAVAISIETSKFTYGLSGQLKQTLAEKEMTNGSHSAVKGECVLNEAKSTASDTVNRKQESLEENDTKAAVFPDDGFKNQTIQGAANRDQQSPEENDTTEDTAALLGTKLNRSLSF